MGLIQASRASTGGGQVTIAGFANDQYTQDVIFLPGTLSIPLSQTPVDGPAITVDYTGQRLLMDVAWSYNGGANTVDILFGDPYVPTYDEPPIFQIVYAYQ